MTVRSRCAMVRMVLFANSLLGMVNFSNRVSMLQNELSDSLSNELVSRVVDAKVMLFEITACIMWSTLPCCCL